MENHAAQLEDRYHLAVRVAGIGTGVVDYISDTIILDQRAASMFSLPVDEPISREDLHARIHPDDWHVIEEKVQHLLEPDRQNCIDVEHRVVHPDGTVLWLNPRKEVDFGLSCDGTKLIPRSGLVAIIDVTSHMEEQQKVRYLLDELNHRSKNLLKIVQSIARMTFSNGEPATFMDRFTSQLRGLSRNQDALVKDRWIHADLADLIEAHFSGFLPNLSDRLKLDGTKVKLGQAAVQAIGMALHELGTNSTKYGALSNDLGRITVDWGYESDPDRHLVITWTEEGGPQVKEPTRIGFGQRVFKELAASSVNEMSKLNTDPVGYSGS